MDNEELYHFLLKWDGFTFNTSEWDFYKAGKGFAVSLVEYEMRIHKNLMNFNLFQTIYGTYAFTINLLPTSNLYFGAYKDGDYYVFDITEIEPDKYTALYKGFKRNQKSIFNFYAGEYIVLKSVNKEHVYKIMKEEGYNI